MNKGPNLHGKTLRLSDAATHAATVYGAIEDLCSNVWVAGSIRRGKPQTADADLVCVPHERRNLLARLDRLVIEEKLKKAIKSDGKTLWGDRMRSFSVDGFKVELFIANPDNAGYILWLRTGPGTANQFAVSYARQKACNIKLEDGYVLRNGSRVSVPDEALMFRLLRMPYIKPAERSEQTYRHMMQMYSKALPPVANADLTFVDAPPVPVQRAMF
ncbi:MAG: hypothetical protein AAF787_00065 [Chloroflexota bacterium]